MKRTGRWLRDTPGTLWVICWTAVLAFQFSVEQHGLLGWVSWSILLLLTLAVIYVFIRLVFRWLGAGGVKRVLAVALVALVALFVVQRIVDPGDDRREIRHALVTVSTSHDPSYCREYVTEAYLEQLTGVEAPFADEACEDYVDSDVDSVGVRAIDIDGDAATAVVDIHGGEYDGSSLIKELIREDEEWKVNRLVGFARFDRQKLTRAYERNFVGADGSRRAAKCAVRRMNRFSDPRLRHILISGNYDVFGRIAVACDRPRVERSFIDGFRAPEYRDYPASAVDCVEKKVGALPDAKLTRLYTDFVAYGSLLLECDRGAFLDRIEGDLRDGGLDSNSVECVMNAVRHRPNADLIRLGYDQVRYGELIDDCSVA